MSYLRRLPLSICVGLVAIALPIKTLGDELTIAANKASYLVYEPIVVTIKFNWMEPDRVIGTIRPNDLRPRKLVLNPELWKDEQLLCKVYMGSVSFMPIDPSSSSAVTTVFFFLGELRPADGRDLTLSPWDEPGEYTLVVRERDHQMESNSVRISLVEPDSREKEAGVLFASGGLALIPALLGREDAKSVVPILERLTKDYNDTVFGRYASAGLALRRGCDLRTLRVGPTDTQLRQFSEELQTVVRSFPPGHPLRSRAMLDLASVQSNPKIEGDAKKTLEQLRIEADDGSLLLEAKRRLTRLRKSSGE